MSQQSWQQGLLPEASSSSSAAQVFSTRAPRDAIAGASSGLKTFARSVAAGSAALIFTPVEAAREGGGIAGTLRGACEGVATAALLPCAGAVVAAGQFARGVSATPQALIESLRGQQWNDSERCWKPNSYSLAEEAKRLESRRRDGKSKKSRKSHSKEHSQADSEDGQRGARVHGREYYKLLKVNPAATGVEIRRAYYRESKQCHPDKAGADPLMVERFQQLSQAYQVLRNSDLRAAYDEGGHAAVVRLSATIDLGSLYAAVLSGPQWEPYIGRLALTRILSGKDEQTGSDMFDSLTNVFLAPNDSPSPWQALREVRLAQALAQRFQAVTDGQEIDFEEYIGRIQRDAEDLAKAPFAPALLLVIADIYANEASRFLGAFNMRMLTLGHELMQTHSQGRLMVLQAQAVSSGTRALLALRSLISEESCSGKATGSASEEPRATTLCLEKPAVQEQLPLLAAALWRLTVLDVEGTLRRVCRRLLADASIDVEVRQRRAEVLLLMASTLRKAAEAHGNTESPGEDRTVLLDKVGEVATQMASAGVRRKSTPESDGAEI